MPPQFFKDAHNGLGNKFVPRGFAFSIGANATNAANQGASAGNTSVDSTETSEMSDALPQASSTAPSTAGSSHFLLKTKNNKKRIQLGGNTVNLQTDEQHGQHLGDKTHEASIPTDVGQDGLSIDTVESLASEISQGASQRATSTAGGGEEDDDVQITDIREVSNAIQSLNVEPDMEADETSGYETSSDLLLEALSKSQKLCTVLKEKLEMANSKIHNQTGEIEAQKKSAEKMRDTFKSFKAYLSDLESRSLELRESRTADNRCISELKQEYQDTVKRVQEYQQQVGVLQQKVEYLKKIKVASNYEVERRNKEINTLKVQLDDTQGLLSEQKIRTVQLEKILESSRKEYDTKVDEMLTKTGKLEESLVAKIGESVKLVEASLGEKVGGVAPCLNQLNDDMAQKIEALTEQFLSRFKVTDEEIASGFKSTTNELAGSFKTSIEDAKSGILSEATQLAKYQQSIGQTLTSLSKSVELISEESKTGSNETMTLCKEVIENIAKLDKDIKDQNSTIASVDEFRTKNEELKAQCETLIKNLSFKDDEVAKFQEEIRATAEEIRTMELAKDEATEELEKLQSKLDSKTSALKAAEEKASKCKSTCDSKMRTQSELYKMVTGEVDKFRKECEELRAKVLELQRELTEKHNTDLELKQEQKANAKVITEKDNVISELELEKIALKKQVQDLHVTIDQYQKESTDTDLTGIVTPKKTLFDDVPKRKQPTPATKSATGKKATEKSTQKLKATQTKKTSKQQQKRKLLDDDEEENLIFDDFELDDVLLDDAPQMPKRYIKRKKTKQY